MNSLSLSTPLHLTKATHSNLTCALGDVNSQVARISITFHHSVSCFEYSKLSPLLGELKGSLQKLESEVKSTQEICKKEKESLNSELGQIVTAKAKLSKECDATALECVKLRQSIVEIQTSCQSLETTTTELRDKIKGVHKLQYQVTNKRWNSLRDLLPLHGFASGLIFDKSLKSALLRTIPGYSQVVGVKSLLDKEYAQLNKTLGDLEAKHTALVNNLTNKKELLTKNETDLRSKETLHSNDEKKLKSKSTELQSKGVKIDDLNRAYLMLGQLVNRCDQLDSETRLVTRKCDHQRISYLELGKFIEACNQFKGDFSRLLQIKA